MHHIEQEYKNTRNLLTKLAEAITCQKEKISKATVQCAINVCTYFTNWDTKCRKYIKKKGLQF